MKKIILPLLLLATVTLYAQSDSTDLIVQRIMKEQRVVGMTLAVVKNGKTLVNKGYGLANAEHAAPMTESSVIRLGSVSKQFFTTAVFTLVEAGKLSIEDPVRKFFPDAPESWKPILVKHLMSHTAGLTREAPAYNNNLIQPDLAIIRSAYPLPLEFKTGEKYQYSNVGYYILAEIISQVSGMPWQEYIAQKIFLPAGMTHTRMTDFYPVIPGRASGYMHRKDTLVNAESMYAVRPSGGFLSTSSDMILWDQVLRAKNNILTKDHWELLWQPFIKTSPDPASKSFYGYAWEIGDYKGHKVISHGGANIGFRSYYARYVNDDLSIIILTNTDEAIPQVMARALADYYFRKL